MQSYKQLEGLRRWCQTDVSAWFDVRYLFTFIVSSERFDGMSSLYVSVL